MNIVERIKNVLRNEKPSIAKALEGNNVHCICCDKDFITFLPFGLIKRANAACPNCGSLERHRLHWHYMKNRTNLFSAGNTKLKLLHVAPESIFYNHFNGIKNIEYIPCDKFEKGYENSYSPKTINVDITNIQFQDNEFDIIYCSHVLEHIIDDNKAMQELYRVLKPGGWAMLQVPLDVNRENTFEDFSIIDEEEREKIFGQKDHVRVYGRDYKNKLANAGFCVKIENYLREFNESEIFRNGFMKGEEIYICSKK